MVDKFVSNQSVEAFKVLTQAIRQELADQNISDFHLTLSAVGRTTAGSCQVSVRLGRQHQYDKLCSGNAVQPVVSEFIHRETWDRDNKCLSLPSPGTEDSAEDQEFDEVF